MVTEVNSINSQGMRERFDRLSGRIASGYAEVPVEEGLAEIDAACSLERMALEPCPTKDDLGASSFQRAH
jgi:hypothetical protein